MHRIPLIVAAAVVLTSPPAVAQSTRQRVAPDRAAAHTTAHAPA